MGKTGIPYPNTSITEIGLIEKRFIDCGGTLRTEKGINFRLWDADDYEHRLKPGKLLHIITLSEAQLDISDDLPDTTRLREKACRYGQAFLGPVTFIATGQRSPVPDTVTCPR